VKNKEYKNMQSYPALELFAELLVPSLSGFEGKVADVIRKRITKLGYDPIIDPAGNIQVCFCRSYG
jgi:putative aminopeptidase FrvX